MRLSFKIVVRDSVCMIVLNLYDDSFNFIIKLDGVIAAIPASLVPNLHPSKEFEASSYSLNDRKTERSEESLSPIFRFLITTVTSTVSTTVSTATVILSTWRYFYNWRWDRFFIFNEI